METLFQNYKIPEKKKSSQRADIIKELYTLYTKSYIPTPKYPNPISIKLFCIKLSPLKDLNVLYFMLSVAKDKYNRKENVCGYILGSIKAR